jgi:thioredoxin 1
MTASRVTIFALAGMICLAALLVLRTIDKPLPRLIDLGSTTCHACKRMAPVLEELKAEYAGVMEVEFIDVFQDENMAKAESLNIEQIPTQLFIAADGKELRRHVGPMTKQEILDTWQELGIDLKPTAPAASTKP